MDQGYYYGLGRRKTAVARVRLFSGTGAFIVNGRPLEEVFSRAEHLNQVLGPLRSCDALGRFSGTVKVMGGGVSGQAGAIRHAIARALVASDEALKPVMRRGGFLTRDPRMKERKKYGRVRARKREQYTKR